MDNSELAEPIRLTAICPHCKRRHPVVPGGALGLGFIRCLESGHSYLASVNGLTLPGPLDEVRS